MTKREELIKKLEDLDTGTDVVDVLNEVFGELSDFESSILIKIIQEWDAEIKFDFARFLSIAEKELDRFTDQVVNADGDVPYYKFGRRAYLSWFRGYSFQVSGDDNGNGDYGSSDTTLELDCRIAKHWPKELRPLMAFSHVCQATTRYNLFWEFILNDSSLLDKFMRVTGEYDTSCHCEDFSLKYILDLVKRTKYDLNDARVIPISRVHSPKSGRTPNHLGEIYFSKKFVAFKDVANNVIALPIPEFDGDTFELSEKDYYFNVRYRLVHVLLNLGGIKTNHMGLCQRTDIEIQDAHEGSVHTIGGVYKILKSADEHKSAMNILLQAGNASNV